MKHQILFIQGGGEGAFAEDSRLASSLQQALGADYEVKCPPMPNEASPDYNSWKRAISTEITALGQPFALVAHSVGAYIMVKHLSEDRVPKAPSIICLIAAPYPGGDKNWEFEGFSLQPDFGAKLPPAAKIFLYHSPDDQIVPFAHLALYARQIPQATVRTTSGGHQLSNNLAAVADDIR